MLKQNQTNMKRLVSELFHTTNSVYSFFCVCRRLLVMPRESTTAEGVRIKSVGVFVQCNPKSPESA